MQRILIWVGLLSFLSNTSKAQQSKRFDSLQQKLMVAYSTGQYQQAAEFAQSSLLYARQDLGEKHIEVGNQFLNIGLMMKSLNKFDSAIWYYNSAEDFFTNNNYTGTTDYVSVLINKGTLAGALGNTDSAIAYMNRAMTACSNINDCRVSATYPTLLNNVANLLMRQSRNREAETILLEADKAAATLKTDNMGVGLMIKNTLATCYINLLEFSNALRYLEQVEPPFRKKFGPSSPSTIALHSNMYLCYYKLGDKFKCDSLAKDLSKKVDKLKDKSQGYIFLANYAMMQKDMGFLEEADRTYNTLLGALEKVYGTKHPDYPMIQNNYVLLLQELGQDTRAYAISSNLLKSISPVASSPYFKGLVTNTVLTSLLALDSLDMGIQLGNAMLEVLKLDSNANITEVKGALCLNMAVAYQKKGDFATALKFINDAIRYVGSKPSLSLLHLYQHRAILLESEMKYKEALQSLEDATALVKPLRIEKSRVYRTLLYNMICNYTEGGQIQPAVKKAKELLAVHQEQLISVLDYLTPSEREYYVNNIVDDLDYLLDFYLYANNKYPGQYINDFLDVLLFREGIMLKTQTNTKRTILQSNDSLLLLKYQHLQNLKANWIYQLQLPPEKQKNVEAMEKEILKLEKEIQTAAKGITENNTNWKQISAALKPGEAYIHFYQAGNISFKATGFRYSQYENYAVIIRRNSSPKLVRVDTARRIASFFASGFGSSKILVSNLYAKNPSGNTPSLYKLLWRPLEKHLAGINRIYLRTNGDINRISFAAIPLPNGKLIADQYKIRRLLVMTDTSFNWDHKAGGIKNMLLIGDVNFNNNGKGNQRTGDGTPWTHLPGTKEEVLYLQQLTQEKNYSSKVLMDSMATEEAVRKTINQEMPGLLHIATHGFFSRKQVKQANAARLTEKGVFAYTDLSYLQSGIVLSGANEYKETSLLADDGILNAYEVQSMNFQHTDLVVLSACETALGATDRQEGVYGLQRAFKIAGAKYQVLSLWKVPDKETQELMKLFYDGLMQGKTYEDAFNQTQDEMKKKYDPYYWAGFILLK